MWSATEPDQARSALKTICIPLLLLLIATIGSSVVAAELFGDFPPQINADETYIFYSHGLIVEGNNPQPVHPEFGTYDFPAIAEALFNSGTFNVIAHHRPAGTDADQYAVKLSNWVRHLINAGVQADNIALVGFSRGAQITLKAANQLNDLQINTAVMAVCFDGDFPTDPPIRLTGNILSIYETTDAVKSCHELLSRSARASSTKEIAITTGFKHGAFYTPRPEWLNPLSTWLAGPGR